MGTIKESIEAANDGLFIYDAFIENSIPWNEFKESLVELDNYRDDFSTEIGLLIVEIKTHLMNGIDAYFYASQDIYEWVRLTAAYLKLYIELFNRHDAKKADAQKQLLIEMLDSGVAQMRTAKTKLGNSSFSLNSTGESLTSLQSRFGPQFYKRSEDFQEQIKEPPFLLEWADNEYFRNRLDKMAAVMKICDDLYKKIKQAIRNIGHAKSLLQEQIRYISHFKNETEQVVQFVNLDEISVPRDTVIQSTQQLIARCEKYRKKHTNNYQSF